MRRQNALGRVAVVLAISISCARAPRAPAAPVVPLHTTPLVDLAPAAGLAWIAELHPRELLEHAELAPAINAVVPEARSSAFAAKNGGVDLRSATELVAAHYGSSTLWLLRLPLDPARIENAFRSRALHVEGRAIDRDTPDPGANIVRTWGTVGGDRVDVAILGREAVGVEVGRFGPLRAAELFAEERLRRASPALHTAPLKRVAELVGDGPVRAFAAGPFEGELAHGLAGLLGASTAVGGAARVVTDTAGGRPGLACTVVVLGGWGNDASAAGERLQAAFGVLAASGVGRLLGLDHALAPARVRTSDEALTLEVTLDAMALAMGLRDATGAAIDEIMGHPTSSGLSSN